MESEKIREELILGRTRNALVRIRFSAAVGVQDMSDYIENLIHMRLRAILRRQSRRLSSQYCEKITFVSGC